MKLVLLTSILVALGAVQCGSEPVGCSCSMLIIKSTNGSPIRGTTIRWITPALADNESVGPAFAEGEWFVGGPGCLPGVFEFEVHHPDYVTQRLRVEDTRRNSLRTCASTRSETINVTLHPLPR